MPINFAPNDPLAKNGPPIRVKSPRPNRPANRAGYTFFGVQPEAVSPPGTPGFLFWQCREAALATLEAWESINGSLARWARSNPVNRLELRPDHGRDLNAFYDRQSVSFFHFTTGPKTTFSGASTDVVAHEVGHALLDQLRPDLWDVSFLEPAAFHEAFGDCIALLTALSDQQTRQALLAVSPDLGTANFVETTAEDLSDGVLRALGPTHPASQPRHALNTFKWQLPATLPTSGPPNVLASEAHSLARVFTGCFYDTLRNIFNALPTRNEATLATAVRTAFRLLIAGSRNAPEIARFFREVGRAMVVADQTQNGGVNRLAIRDAFASHNIALGSSAMLAPTSALAGRAPRAAAAASAILTPTTRRDLLRRIDAPENARLAVDMVDLGDEQVAHAVYQREVPLDDVSEQLAGVVMMANEPTLVGASGTRAAVLGALPQPTVTMDEVHAFARALLDNGQIDLGRGATRAPRAAVTRRRAVARETTPEALPTHAVRTRGRRKTLTRVRFACWCGS